MKNFVKKYIVVDDIVYLIFDDFSILQIEKNVFNRAFGCIISVDKETIIRDFGGC